MFDFPGEGSSMAEKRNNFSQYIMMSSRVSTTCMLNGHSHRTKVFGRVRDASHRGRVHCSVGHSPIIRYYMGFAEDIPHNSYNKVA